MEKHLPNTQIETDSYVAVQSTRASGATRYSVSSFSNGSSDNRKSVVKEVSLVNKKNANNNDSIRKRANWTWEGRYTDGYNDAGRQIQRSVYGMAKPEKK